MAEKTQLLACLTAGGLYHRTHWEPNPGVQANGEGKEPQEMRVRLLGQEGPLEKEMATHSNSRA